MQVVRWIGKHGSTIRKLSLDLYINVGEGWHAYHGGVVALLAHVPNLQHLEVSGPGHFMTAESHLYVLEFLPKLLDLTLHLSSSPSWSVTTLVPLKHLTSLTSLEIHAPRLSTPLLVAPELAQLTQLQQLKLDSWGNNGTHERWTDQDHLFKTISQLTNLTKLALHSMLDSVPAEIASLAQLQVLHLQEAHSDQWGSVTTPMAFPASLASCSRLRDIFLMAFSPASVKAWRAICTSLALLPGLVSLGIIDTRLEAVSDDDWVLSSRLTALSLSSCGLTRVPSAACQLSHLHSLSMGGSSLARLDTGPYLSSVRHMTIQCDGDTKGSDVLGKAAQLKSLLIFGQSADSNKHGCFSWPQLEGLLPAGCMLRVLCTGCHGV